MILISLMSETCYASTTAEHLSVEAAGPVATIWFDRPRKKNAFTLPMFIGLEATLDALNADVDVSVVVLAARGDAFCAGVDLEFFNEPRDVSAFKAGIEAHIQRVGHAVDRFDKPLLAAVHGPAVGAGCDLALMADVRIAATSARFSTGYIRLGLAPGGGCAYYLPRAVGLSRALELLFTGDVVDGTEAQRIGLVSRTVPDPELAATVADLASRIAARDLLALRLTKRAVYAGLRADLRTILDLSSSHAATAGARSSGGEPAPTPSSEGSP